MSSAETLDPHSGLKVPKDQGHANNGAKVLRSTTVKHDYIELSWIARRLRLLGLSEEASGESSDFLSGQDAL